jgi:L-lactate dehydrogenase complex protein LldG
MSARSYDEFKARMNSRMNLDIINLRRKYFQLFNDGRELAKKKYQTDDLEKRVRSIKKESISHIEDLMKLTKERLEQNGVHVCLAQTAEDAVKYLLQVIEPSDVVAQSSTDLVNELNLYEHLAKRGIPFYHTEPNYRIIQLNPEMSLFDKPSGTVHLTKAQLAQILSRSLGKHIPEEDKAIFDAQREDLNLIFQKSTVGITGANSISAADGDIVLCYTSGNISRVASLKKHVVLAGIEKIVPNFADAMSVVYLQSLYESGVGGATNYFVARNATHGYIEGREFFEGVGSREMHVVLLDDGRRRMIQEGFEEALYCIRCFTCHHYCPTYHVLGPGSGFGLKEPGFGYKGYIGGRGTVFSSFVYGLQAAMEGGLFSCTLCGSCYEHCPLQINVPAMIGKIRKRAVTRYSEESE